MFERLISRFRSGDDDPAANLLASIADEPFLLDAGYVDKFVASVASIPTKLLSNAATVGFWQSGWMSRYQPYNVDADGILDVPVTGGTLNGFPFSFSWATGYDYVVAAVERGMVDSEVRGIRLSLDTFGGEAQGAFEAVDALTALRGRKPIAASVDNALSGGYAIASVADEIAVRLSGSVGSVGVISVVTSIARALEQRGVDVTLVRSGRRKAEGNPFEALSAEAQQRIQDRSDYFYGLFTSRVARNRRMTEQAVRATEALSYSANEGVSVGFADRIGEPESVRRRLVQGSVGRSNGRQPASAQDAVAAERRRQSTVLASEHYAGREALGNKLLAETEFSAASIVGLLENAPNPGSGNGGGFRDHFAEAKRLGLFDGLTDGDEDGPEHDDPRWPGRSANTVRILHAARLAGQEVDDDLKRAARAEKAEARRKLERLSGETPAEAEQTVPPYGAPPFPA